MTKTVDTLADDIYHVLDTNEEHGANVQLASLYGERLAGVFTKASALRIGGREKGKLWASDIGKKCMRQQHYNFNCNEMGEELDGHTRFKFLYGNILEEAVLYFAEEAGHVVSCQQARVELEVEDWLVSGRIDCVIDDALVDVKTASTYSFNKYRKEGLNHGNDTFGYLWQLAFYKHFGGFQAPRSGFLFIDKQNGHIHYVDVTDSLPSKAEVEQRIRDIIQAVGLAEEDVGRGFPTTPYGKSGNMSLGIECSYCPFKAHCWRDSNGGVGLRGFAYNHKPIWFTEIVREPNVPELKL